MPSSNFIEFQTSIFLQFWNLSHSIEETQSQIQDIYVRMFLEQQMHLIEGFWKFSQGFDKAQNSADWLRFCGYYPERGLQSVEVSRDMHGEHYVLYANFGR